MTGPGIPVDLELARWIARPVPAAQRILRQIRSDRVDWVEPGHELSQTFVTDGSIVAVNVDLVGPGRAAEAHGTDMHFTVSLEAVSGDVVASRTYRGPQLVWDYFGPFLDVNPPAPPGTYEVVVRSTRGRVGWSTAEAPTTTEDDGVSPRPIVGTARADGVDVHGVRLIGVETLPAPNPLFRRRFRVAASAASARLAASVLGAGVISINGTRVGAEMLEPAVTDYDKTVLYRAWDVTHLLRVGENEIMIEAGRERYSARGGDTWGWNLAPWHREPVALVRLDITESSGAEQVLVTDADWETAPGPVRAERFFRGEDWAIGGPEPEWEPARVVDAPQGALRLSEHPPVTAGEQLQPVTVTTLADGSRVYDFGAVIVGRLRCRVEGPRGGSIDVISGEQLAADGSVLCDNFLVPGEAQLDTVALEGDTTGTPWEIRFGYRGFRWIQVTTRRGAAVEEVTAVPLYTDIEVTGEFETDEPVLQWIDSATARTFRNNLHGIPTDTPIYEKNGWTADAHLATEGLLHHFDLRASFGKWLRDHADAQGPDGSIPQIIPTPGWGRASDPVWSSSAVLIPWYLYREYGDVAILSDMAPVMRRFADYVLTRLDEGIWRDRTWGDWLSPGHQLGPEGMAPVGTAATVNLLATLASALDELGEPDGLHYREQAALVAAAYHDAWFDPRAGSYRVPGVGYRQVLDILPLAFGIAPPQHVDSVRAALIDDIENRTTGHLDCGAVGIRHLLPVLSDAGRDDLAITVLTNRSRPGWGAWFRDGESTLLESWDVDARSRNHYFLGSVDAWIQQRVGGLRAAEPGWRRIEIAPVDDSRVTRARIRHRTPLGHAGVSWERGEGGWMLEVEVPEGSAARVSVGAHEVSLDSGPHRLHLPPITD